MTQIFNITHEVGDLSEYDVTATDGGDLSVATAAALAATSYGLSCLIDDTTAIYGRKDYTQLTSSSLRFRFYFDPNGLTLTSGDQHFIAVLTDTADGRVGVQFGQTGGSYGVLAQVLDDSSTWQSTSKHGLPAPNDGEHYIEVLVERASSDVASDGTLTLWIDGSQQEQVTGLDVYDISQPNRAYLGAPSGLDAGTSGTYYLDEFILRDDSVEIGSARVAKNTDSHPLGIYTAVSWRLPTQL